ERDLRHLRLRELSPSAARRLLQSAAGEALDDEALTALVERAGGNALYLEELVRAVVERRSAELPKTVHAGVEARLAKLDPDLRRVLRAASVFGGAFWSGGVTALLGGPEFSAWAGEQLAALVEREVILRRAGSRFPSEEEYAFGHTLVREG